MDMNVKLPALTIGLLVTSMVFTSSVSAALISTSITAKVVDISGVQTPIGLSLNDIVNFNYIYNDARAFS